MNKTKIEWADVVWNPVSGCSKVSEGCRNCYAETYAKRFWGERKFTDVQCHYDRLAQPLHWKKPRRIFVNSMSDLFHQDASNIVAEVFATMERASWHTFIILTKRPASMLGLWPLPNVWLGVSVEDQKTADERIPLLLQTPAAKRIVSYEPALGKVYIDSWLRTCDAAVNPNAKIDWVILGGESGRNARPMHPDWARSVRDQCQEAGVPFFFKQWGEYAPDCLCKTILPHKSISRPTGKVGLMFRCGKKNAGRLLDGREWNEMPC